MIERFTFDNEQEWLAQRALDVTSTESAALFDLNPYLTRFELYHRKANKVITTLPLNNRMTWGLRLQDAVALGIAEDQGVGVRRMDTYMRISETRMGSSFDFEVVGLVEEWTGDDTPMRRMFREHGRGVFEIKCVDFIQFRNNWIVDDDEIDAPAHIEIQVQHQLHVADRLWAAIGVLVSGDTSRVVIRERDREVGAEIERRIRGLFDMVRAGSAPAPTFPEDAALVIDMNSFAEPGRVYDGRQDKELLKLCHKYSRRGKLERRVRQERDILKAQILARIGESERALIPGFTVSAGMVAPSEFVVRREAYRNLRVTPERQALADKTSRPDERGAVPIEAA